MTPAPAPTIRAIRRDDTNPGVTPPASPSVPPSSARIPITLHSALLSALRVWFSYRDEALWAFVSGVDEENVIEQVNLEQCSIPVEQMTQARRQVNAIARQISQDTKRPSELIIREAVDSLLSTESPKLLLTSHVPGAF